MRTARPRRGAALSSSMGPTARPVKGWPSSWKPAATSPARRCRRGPWRRPIHPGAGPGGGWRVCSRAQETPKAHSGLGRSSPSWSRATSPPRSIWLTCCWAPADLAKPRRLLRSWPGPSPARPRAGEGWPWRGRRPAMPRGSSPPGGTSWPTRLTTCRRTSAWGICSPPPAARRRRCRTSRPWSASPRRTPAPGAATPAR